MKIRWVDDCDTCAREGLGLAAQSHKLRIGLAGGAPQPPLEALLPEACAPIKLLQARWLKVEKGLADERDKPQMLQRDERATLQLSGANHVPLRSERPQRYKRLRAGASEEQLCLPPEGPGGGPMLLRGDEALHQPSLPWRRGPSLADLRRARPAEREAGPECPSNVGGTSASHRTAHSPGAAGDPTPRIAKCVRLAVLLNSCQAVAGMSVPHRATAPLPEPASQSAPVMLLALVVAALAAALWRAAVIASAGDSNAPTAALVASLPPSPPPMPTHPAPFPGVTSEYFPDRRRVYRQTMYHRVHEDREAGRLRQWFPGAYKW